MALSVFIKGMRRIPKRGTIYHHILSFSESKPSHPCIYKSPPLIFQSSHHTHTLYPKTLSLRYKFNTKPNPFLTQQTSYTCNPCFQQPHSLQATKTTKPIFSDEPRTSPLVCLDSPRPDDLNASSFYLAHPTRRPSSSHVTPSRLSTSRRARRYLVLAEILPESKTHLSGNTKQKRSPPKQKKTLLKMMDIEGEVVRSSRFKRVCVFCGSSTGKRSCYSDAAMDLANELVARRLDLVYGGGSVGLMGIVSRAVHHGGGGVIGIIPRTLMSKEITGETVGEVRPVTDMHQRKSEMARLADCFIALPGGYGTMEELLEVITWAQLGIHDKPVGLLNVDGYYNSLLTFIDKAIDEGFIKPSERNIIVSAPNAKQLFQKLQEYVPMHDGVVAKARWELDKQQAAQQQVGFNATTLQAEVATASKKRHKSEEESGEKLGGE